MPLGRLPENLDRAAVRQYGAAAAAIAAGLVAWRWLAPAIGEQSACLIFAVAILLTARRAGRRPNRVPRRSPASPPAPPSTRVAAHALTSLRFPAIGRPPGGGVGIVPRT